MLEMAILCAHYRFLILIFYVCMDGVMQVQGHSFRSLSEERAMQ